ncbi:MAG: hypothetical protein AAGI69_08990 [Cyanobacteria bacterium P01_H01_bin.21]
MSYCICCNSSLLRHIRHGEVYWYCPDCRQDMPEVDSCTTSQSDSSIILSTILLKPLVLADA